MYTLVVDTSATEILTKYHKYDILLNVNIAALAKGRLDRALRFRITVVDTLPRFRNFLLHYMQEGTIARLTDKNFGFIKIDGQAKDLFFHANELKNVQWSDLHEGDKVSFEVAEGPKGLNAVNVSKI